MRSKGRCDSKDTGSWPIHDSKLIVLILFKYGAKTKNPSPESILKDGLLMIAIHCLEERRLSNMPRV